VPVLFVYGKNDKRIPIEIAISQAMIPSHSEILLLDHVGHMSFMEEREYVKPRIKNFVDTCFY
jgi:pimeloyl-ACP methyl ester carboxylesterase